MRRLPIIAKAEPAASGAGEGHHLTKGLVRVTMACNERCPFCNVPVEDYARPVPSDAQVQQELDALIESGEQTLTLSGGEPTLERDRLLRLAAEARARGVRFVELQTNAILVDAAYAKALATAGITSAFVSLLSDRAELHDELAGLRGAFELCLRGIDALLDAGVSVTLNPVVARSTQRRVADYVDFVAERFPAIVSISLSAVQPHGRAATNTALMPDYDVLGAVVREAQQCARRHGITLLNPYCGLPACVGWSEALGRSVEAIEAAVVGGRDAPGVHNDGNKRQGAVCTDCVLRARCGGAWHAYWHERRGRGLSPPASVRLPWHGDGEDEFHDVVSDEHGVSEAALERLAGCRRPVVWFQCAKLQPGDATKLLHTPCTDVAVVATGDELASGATFRELASLTAATLGAKPQRVKRAHVLVTRVRSFRQAWEVATAASRVRGVVLRFAVRRGGDHARFERFVQHTGRNVGGLNVALEPVPRGARLASAVAS